MPYTLTEKTGIAPDAVQHWNSVLIAVYGAALLAFSPICGHLADHHSTTRRAPLLAGLAALAAATAMLNVGTSIGVLVAARLLQGASAAVVWVVGLALLVDTVGRDDVGQAMGWVSMAMSLAVLVAPLLGGVVLERAGYDAVWAMAYALLGVDVVARLVLVEKRVAGRWVGGQEEGGGVDGAETAAADGRCCCGEGGGGEGGGEDEDGGGREKEEEEEKEKERGSADISPVSGQELQDSEKQQQPTTTTRPCPHHDIARHDNEPTTTIPQHPRRLRDRLPPTLSLLLSARLASSLWSTLVVSILMSSLDAVLPLYVRARFNWSSTGAGLIFLPVVIPSFLAPAFGALADRGLCAPRYLAAGGALVACPCWVCLRFVDDDIDGDALKAKVVLCVLLAVLGVALAAIMPCVMAEITHVVRAKEAKRPGAFGKTGAYAQAYGLFNMAWAGGALVGPIWAGYVKDTAGWGTMGWSLGLLAACSAVPAVLWTGGWVCGKKEKERSDEESGGQRT
ncbi:putative MFS-type transporter [Diplodia seriata]|uniref:Putative MFS-type transporter n=1 Tax=Diplodia seriata TaxID=420778 RepID=A0A1S8B5C3_9PEZI|nr:putative MFS-type transporter [Diplodia seriata]